MKKVIICITVTELFPLHQILFIAFLWEIKFSNFSLLEIDSQAINLLYGEKKWLWFALLSSVFIAPRCFTDDSKVHTMSGCSGAKFMLRKKEERRRPEAGGF